jgi:hypothetical protein
VPGGSGRERARSSARRPRGESSAIAIVLLNRHSTTPEPEAPPADEVEVLELEGELLVGSAAFRRFCCSWFSLLGNDGACDFAGAEPAPLSSPLNWRSRSSAPKSIGLGSKMPAEHVPVQMSSTTTTATLSAAVDIHRVGHERRML